MRWTRRSLAEGRAFGSHSGRVRIHEKALSDYLDHFDDWDDAKVIPEACVLDVLRARVVCPNAAGMIALLSDLDKGVHCELEDGQSAQLALIRCKNKFETLDPTHFRNLLNNLKLVSGGREAFAEVQVQHAEILRFNDAMHAHDHYNFFRSLLAGSYQEVLNEMLERTVVFALSKCHAHDDSPYTLDEFCIRAVTMC